MSARFSLTLEKEANVRLMGTLLLTDATWASGISCNVIWMFLSGQVDIERSRFSDIGVPNYSLLTRFSETFYTDLEP